MAKISINRRAECFDIRAAGKNDHCTNNKNNLKIFIYLIANELNLKQHHFRYDSEGTCPHFGTKIIMRHKKSDVRHFVPELSFNYCGRANRLQTRSETEAGAFNGSM